VSASRRDALLAKLAIVTTLPFVAALTILLVNDLYLKEHWASWLTGKLSDLAGLMVVALLALEFFARTRIATLVVIGLAFVYWKSPYSQPLLDYINDRSAMRFGRVVDYSDLLALFVLPASARISSIYTRKRSSTQSMQHVAMVPIVVLTVIGVAGTSALPYWRELTVQGKPPESLVSAAPIEAKIAEVLGRHDYECTTDGRLQSCSHDDFRVSYCSDGGRLWLIATGPLNRGIVGPRTGRGKRKDVDELVAELGAALALEFDVITDDRSYRDPGSISGVAVEACGVGL
jgi:hypothetical protein